MVLARESPRGRSEGGDRRRKQRRKLKVNVESLMISRGTVEEGFVDHVDDLGCKMGSGQSEINPAITSKVSFERLVEWIPVFPYVDQTKKVAEFL